MKLSARLPAFLFLLLTAASAPAAPDILVEGWDGTFWQNIDDGDLVANQQVTDFDRVELGSPERRRYRVRNTGNDQLALTSNSSSNTQFTIIGLAQSVNVPAGNSNEFEVEFDPTSRGNKTTTITIRSNDPDAEDPYTFALTGTAEGPEISMHGDGNLDGIFTFIADGDTAPSTVDGTDFGTIAAGSTRDRAFRIFNDGDSGLTYTTPTITGPNAAAFELRSLSTIDRTIGAGNIRDFEIRFSPDTAGVKTAHFSMGSNDADESPYTFTLQGTATGQPDIQIQGQEAGIWNNIADGDHNPDQAVTDFGNEDLSEYPQSTDPRTRTYRVRNDGNDSLNITARSSSGAEFTISGLPAGTTVPPGGTNEFTIAFAPFTLGTRTARITITSNSPGAESTYTFDVTGFGRGPEMGISGNTAETGSYTAIPDGDTTPTSGDGTDFGTVAVGSRRDRFFRISNTGNAGLNLLHDSIQGSGAAHFSIRSLDTTTNVGNGNSRDFVIRFEPTSGGTKTATFWIESNDYDENAYTFTITGTATTEPDIQVRGQDSGVWNDIADGDGNPDQAVTDFGRVNLGASRSRDFRIVNDGTARLTISARSSSNAQYGFNGLPAGTEVAAGAAHNFTIVFTPTARATATTTITITSDDPDSEGTYIFALTGIGEGPEFNLQGRGEDQVFRAIPDGSTVTQSVNATQFGSVNVTAGLAARVYRITNAGDKPLTITGRSFSGDAAADFSVNDLLIAGLRIINAGNSIDITIEFRPRTSGTRNAVLSINSDDADEDPYTFAITGNGVGTPEIKIQGNRPSEPRVEIVDGDTTPRQAGGTLFADTADNNERTHNFRIHNDGDGRLTFSPPTMTGANPTLFQITGFSTSPLDPGETLDFNITFRPGSFGVKTAIFSLPNNDPNEGPYNFTLQGTGLGSEISVQGGAGFTEEIVNGDLSPREADGTDFGFVGISGQSASRTFRVRNTGNEIMFPFAVSSPSAAFTLAMTGDDTLEAGTSRNFTVTFNPSTAGPQAAIITVTNDDPNESPFTFKVRGNGTDANPGIRVTGDNNTAFTSGQTATSAANGTDMGEVNTASGTAVRFFHIENTGTGVLTLNTISSNNSFFTTGASGSTSVNPGDSTDFSVTFDPLNAGVFTATISITSNVSGSSPFTFRVTGEGVSTAPPAAPELDLFGGDNLDIAIVNGDTTPRRRDGTDFEQAEAGTAVMKTFRIRNTGNAPLTISSATATGAGSVNGVAASIPAGGSDDFTVTINRANPGTANVTVTITSNDANESPFTFLVTLEAVAPGSVFALTNFQAAGSDISLTFTSVPGRTYRVTASTALSGWLPLTGFTGIPGDSLPQTVVLPGAIAPEISDVQFYRIEQE